MNLSEWAVANRRFGAAITFVLIAGEVFSTYSFLGRDRVGVCGRCADLLLPWVRFIGVRRWILDTAAALADCPESRPDIILGLFRKPVRKQALGLVVAVITPCWR